MKISNSEIGTFLDCRRKWYLHYYLHFTKKRGAEADHLSFGLRMHSALGAWYVSHGQEDPRKVIREIYAEDRPLAIQDGTDMKEFDEHARMSGMLVDYYMEKVLKEGFDMGWTYIGSEQEMEIELIEDVNFIGKIDALVERERDGTKFMLEHKTYGSSSASQHIKVAHIEPQHIGYMMLYRMTHDDYLSGTVLNIIKKVKTLTRSKTPILVREVIRHNQIEIDNYFKRLQMIAQEIKNLSEDLDTNIANPVHMAYPTPSTDCSWKCDFFQVCPMMDDGSDWRGMLEKNFEEYDPYARYEEVNVERAE